MEVHFKTSNRKTEHKRFVRKKLKLQTLLNGRNISGRLLLRCAENPNQITFKCTLMTTFAGIKAQKYHFDSYI